MLIKNKSFLKNFSQKFWWVSSFNWTLKTDLVAHKIFFHNPACSRNLWSAQNLRKLGWICCLHSCISSWSSLKWLYSNELATVFLWCDQMQQLPYMPLRRACRIKAISKYIILKARLLFIQDLIQYQPVYWCSLAPKNLTSPPIQTKSLIIPICYTCLTITIVLISEEPTNTSWFPKLNKKLRNWIFKVIFCFPKPFFNKKHSMPCK